jgi:hypothetical protein
MGRTETMIKGLTAYFKELLLPVWTVDILAERGSAGEVCAHPALQ